MSLMMVALLLLIIGVMRVALSGTILLELTLVGTHTASARLQHLTWSAWIHPSVM